MSNLDLKKRRKELGMTQEQLAKELGVNRRRIINYENGEVIPESKEKLLHIILAANVKKFSEIDSLEVKESQELISNKNGNIFFEKNGNIYIEAKLVTVKAFGSYLSDNQDPEFLENLETRIFKADHVGKGNYICFEVQGDSMNGGGINDAPEGAELLCRELGRQHWKDGFRDSQYGWVIVHKETVLFKDIKSFNNETGDMVLSSRSGLPNHGDFTISMNDVMQIWKVIKRTQ